jgi:RES domain-containing protein
MGFLAHQRRGRGDRRRPFQSARCRSALPVPLGPNPTALEEYKQGAGITPPATLAAYKITLAEVPDLSQGFDPDSWEGAWQEWNCAWRQIARIEKKVPPSWKLADIAITTGLRGILFPSLRHAGGTNLAIFPANLVDGDHVAVHDPDHRLPQDQSSWPRGGDGR